MIPEVDGEALDAFTQTALSMGCPIEQINNFITRGYIPTRKGMEFHAAARQADQWGLYPDEIGIGGARGGGKSHTTFAQLALDDCQRAPGLKALYLRKIGKRVREQLDDLKRRVLPHTPHEYNRSEGIIRFPNGSTIVTGHFRNESDVDDYLGIEYDTMVIEETTALTITKYQALRDSNRTSRTDWRPRIYNSTNPLGVGHYWYKDRFINPHRDGAEGYTRFIPSTVDDNPYIDPEYRRKLEGNTGFRLRAYRYGDWDVAAGQFFTTFRYETHARLPFQIPPHWRVWAAMDYGFIHPNVILIFAADEDDTVYTVSEIVTVGSQPSEVARLFRERLEELRIAPSRITRFVAGHDCFIRGRELSGLSIADRYREYGIILSRANIDRVNGWALMSGMLGDIDVKIAPTWYIFNTCRKLLSTLPILEHNPSKPEDLIKINATPEGDGGDDAADCARYGLMAAKGRKMTVGQVDFYAPNRPPPPKEPEGVMTLAQIEEILGEYERGN